MTPGWQEFVAGVLVVSALGWLVWRRVLRRRKPGEPACADCPSAGVTHRTPQPLPRIQVLYTIEKKRTDR